MKSRKWAIIAGAVTAAIVLLVALGYGVNEIAAQGPDVAPEAERQGDCSGRRGGPGADAALWGWQARGQVEVVAETLGLSVEELTEALHEGQSVAELAEAQGVELEALVQALLASPQERLAQAVADGRLTQAEADERLVEIEQRMREFLDEPGRLMRGSPAGRMGAAQSQGWQARGQVELVAETLGLSVEELTEALHEGQSVAELAEAQGVELDTLVQALLAAPQERLDQAVADGRLTQEEADERLVEIEAQILERLQQPGLLGEPQRGGRGHPQQGRGGRPQRGIGPGCRGA